MNPAHATPNHSPFAVMVRRTLAALALTAAVVATASTASAEKIADLSYGDWTGGAFTHSHSGAFSHCAVNAKYRSGIDLFFSVTGTHAWLASAGGAVAALVAGFGYCGRPVSTR